MKTLVVGVVILAFGATPAFADLTCWYNAHGDYYGADDALPNFPVGKVTRGNGGDYSYGYTVTGGPSDCPRKVPRH